MKKSNKLLLGGFLALLVFVTAIHVTLYAKYKAGKYTDYNAEDDLGPLAMQQFPNILFVSVRNVQGATVRFSDVAQLPKPESDDLQYTRHGDTLQITGNPDQEDFRRPVAFYLPNNATLSLYNSSLSFEQGKRTEQASPVIYMQNSYAVFSGSKHRFQVNSLRIRASDRSTILLQGNTQVNQFDLQLSNSELTTGEANFNQLSIVTDSLSRISLPTKQLLKATIKTIPTE